VARQCVGKVSELEPGCIERVEVDGVAYCLAHLEDGGIFAIDDRCTHEDESLSDGELSGDHVECPAHGSRFSVKTGDVTGMPATIPTKTYSVVVEGDQIFLDV